MTLLTFTILYDKITENFIDFEGEFMSIIFNKERNLFKLDTLNSTYAFKIDRDGLLKHLYYGKKVPDLNLEYTAWPQGMASFMAIQGEENRSLSVSLMEYSANGMSDVRNTAIAIKGQNGSNVTDIRYKSHKIYKGKPAIEGLPATYVEDDSQADTLEVVLYDELFKAEVTLVYTAFNNYDAIARSVRVKNVGDASVDIERLYSACVDFNSSDFELLHLHGKWGKERLPVKRHLEYGLQGIHSKRGASGHVHNPFIALCADGSNEEYGDVYGFSFVYSGSFSAEVEVNCVNQSRVLMGLNPNDFGWHLEAGEQFNSPEVVMVYSDSGLGGMSRTYHKLYRNNLCRGKYKLKKRPVLVNNWEGTYFDFDDDKLFAIAEQAAELGIEMFVMDDGWFGQRDKNNNATASLGDWYVNENKLKGGLKKLVDRINGIGLKFGIWFEPEMVNPDSDLYRAHPDWCLHTEGREMSISRNQYVLDMSRKEVRDNIFDQMYKILSSANIEYVKWDFNRILTEISSTSVPTERQKEVSHRYMLGVYELMERLLKEFPDLIIEGCASGGGRFDAGMLYYAPQIWTSDDTDAMERVEIQYGTSIAYPISSISAHVSAVPNHQTGRTTSFETRGNVALAGTFGYELDLTKLTQEEKEMAKNQIKQYNDYYDLIQSGDYYRLIDPFKDKLKPTNSAAWMSVSEDKNEFLMTYVVFRGGEMVSRHIKLQGLDKDKIYVDSQTGAEYSGALLMSAGLNFSNKNWHDGESVICHFKAK